ncbi:MAG: DUF5667 domain-containing protein [Bacteroidota bacterium]|nr:DUF5667 domain-containing protein [Bacteroidota bacterium]
MKNNINLNFGILIVMLLSVTGGSLGAAQLSLPGENLYKLKTVSENMRVALVWSEKSKAIVHSQISEEKIKEIEKLNERKGKNENVEVALENMSKHQEKVMEYVEKNNDKQFTDEKENIIKQQKMLTDLKNRMPESAQRVIQNALDASSKRLINPSANKEDNLKKD